MCKQFHSLEKTIALLGENQKAEKNKFAVKPIRSGITAA
jgi:hypothetical protein